MTEQITLYTGKISPFAHRAEIAIEESGAPAIRELVPLRNDLKPAWFTEKVNPLGQIPALAYGAQPSPDQPSDTSVKINESLVIVEFIADLYPEAKLIPSDPVTRAKARVFASFSDSMLFPAIRGCFLTGKADVDSIFEALDHLQSLLPNGTMFAVGDQYTIADIAAAPHFCRLLTFMKNDLGKFRKGTGLKMLETYNSSKYQKIREYVARLLERESVKKTYAEETFRSFFSTQFGDGR